MGDLDIVSITWKYLFWLEWEQEIAGCKSKTEGGKKLRGRPESYQLGGNSCDSGKSWSRPALPSLPGVSEEASGCTETRSGGGSRLSFTVIPPHKSVLCHPRCTDKATKHRLIHTRNGERVWVTFPSPICVICFSFIRSETADEFFFYARDCCLFVCSLAVFALVGFPAVWLWSSGNQWIMWKICARKSWECWEKILISIKGNAAPSTWFKMDLRYFGVAAPGRLGYHRTVQLMTQNSSLTTSMWPASP